MAGDLNESAYREEQLKFVTNVKGSEARETLLLLLPSVCGLFLMASISSLGGRYVNARGRFLLEFLTVVLPTILCCTMWSEVKVLVCVAMLSMSCTNVALVALMPDLFARGAGTGSSTPVAPRRFQIPFLTNFRALTSLITAICILGVDFPVFPRRYAKTEVFGYSLMDTGVGFFVLSNALVSREARSSTNERSSGFAKRAYGNFIDCLRECGPLLLLGSARYWSVEWLGYQKQVTEYGVHWNFFVTLAVVRVFTGIVATIFHPKYSLPVGIVILVAHEYLLNQRKVMKWLFSSTREGFVSSNREGIVSTPGYAALYLVGVTLGRLIHSTYKHSKGSEKTARLRLFGRELELRYDSMMVLCVKLSLISAQGCAATLILDSYFRISRRFANAGYCAWMLTIAAVMLTILVLIEIIVGILNDLVAHKRPNGDSAPASERHRITSVPRILEAINYNGLAFFLFTNLLTGAVNTSTRTLYVEDATAVQILVGYMALSTILFVILCHKNFRLKIF